MTRYKKNQIVEMICQLRFSTILKINNENSEELSLFQELVKKDFPNYNILNENTVNVDVRVGKDNSEDFVPTIFKENNKNHMFSNEENTERINLTSNYISLSTNNYTSWEDFKSKFMKIIKKFDKVYNTSIFNRIGIRYTNAFSKADLNIKESDKWSEFINDGLLGLTQIYENVRVFNSNIEIPFGDTTQMRIISGLGEKKNSDLMPTPVFIIDTDTYKINNINIEAIENNLNQLHNHSSEMFEMLIKEKLREKMGKIEDEQ